MAIGLSKGQCSNTASAIYTNPTGKKTSVKSIILFNSNTATETVKVYCVNANGGNIGTAAASDQILSISLTSGNTFEFTPGYPIELTALNDTIQAESTTASKLNYIVNGVVVNV